MLKLCLMVLGLTGLRGPGGVWKRVRRNRKTPAHLVNQCFLGSLSRLRFTKRLRGCDHHDGACADDVRVYPCTCTRALAVEALVLTWNAHESQDVSSWLAELY